MQNEPTAEFFPYNRRSSNSLYLVSKPLSPEITRKYLNNALMLLNQRGLSNSAALAASLPFEIATASTEFGDPAMLLQISVPMDEYERLRTQYKTQNSADGFAGLAEVLAELGILVDAIIVKLILEDGKETSHRAGLTDAQIKKLVRRYIGVNGGYLGDFSYQSHADFYTDLDLDINPYKLDGTTRQRFEEILIGSIPSIQARILAGILKRYPVGSSDLRTQERADEIGNWITRLSGVERVDTPELATSSEVVERALRDAEVLLASTGASSGVDRAHTALHGYLQGLCAAAAISIPDDASMSDLFKRLKDSHPAFKDLGPRPDDISQVFRSISAIISVLNPLRNRTSIAHPNPSLLPEPEAELVLNAVRTLLHYLDAKAKH